MRGRVKHLFADKDLRAVMDGQVQAMLRDIDRRSADSLLGDDTNAYCEVLAKKFEIAPVQLHEDGIKASQEDTTIEACDSPYAIVYDRGRPTPAPATRVRFYVPFSGEPRLFDCRPSSFSTVFPSGRIEGNELVLEYIQRDHNVHALKASFDSDLERVKQYLGWIANDLASFPAHLVQEARARIQARRAKLTQDREMLDKLGYPSR